jgi:mannose-6-phosphate isomerase class I
VETSKRYEVEPRYPVGSLVRGWHDAVAGLPAGPVVLAVDGPSHAEWDAISEGITAALAEYGRPSQVVDMRTAHADWATIVDRTSSPAMSRDPDFEVLCEGGLELFFDELPVIERGGDVALVVGPGAALVDHDELWYADVPKRVAESLCRQGQYVNLGKPPDAGEASTKRLFYVDWPVIDRHRDELAGEIDRWVDVQDPRSPVSIQGAALRREVAHLVRAPFRTKPWFNTTVWGGHWAQEVLGVNPGEENTALGYELIAPESGVVLGDEDASVEVPLQLMAALCPEDLLGPEVHEIFGTSFPIRFDFLDTMGGGPLSVHCHPRKTYMKEVFGWPYTQDESYYLVKGAPGNVVYLGLHDGVDVDAFRTAARAADEHGRTLDIGAFIQTFPADQHQLFLVPAGTPHASGEGNVVLEISATPYLYSLRFYDWLRGRDEGEQRPVHVGHAFANLDTGRRGARVREELVQRARAVRAGDGWQEDVIGALDEMFFEVRRVDIAPDAVAPADTGGRFHVLNVVDGAGIEVETSGGTVHHVAFAETLIVPAVVGGYRLRAQGEAPARVVKAFVR